MGLRASFGVSGILGDPTTRACQRNDFRQHLDGGLGFRASGGVGVRVWGFGFRAWRVRASSKARPAVAYPPSPPPGQKKCQNIKA